MAINSISSPSSYQLPTTFPQISNTQSQFAFNLTSMFMAGGFTTSQGMTPQMQGAFGGMSTGFGSLLQAPSGFNQNSLQNSISMLQGSFAKASGMMGSFASLGQSQGFMGAMFSNQQRMMPMQYGSFMAQQSIGGFMATQPGVAIRAGSAVGKDEFATHRSCRKGKHNPSNLNNSDHIKLALHDMFQKAKKKRGGFKSLGSDWKKIATRLKDEYGINATATKIKTKSGDTIKALKFENGAVMADGAGDGQMDMGDYNFKGAIKEIEQKYGMKADDMVKSLKENGGFARADFASQHHNAAFTLQAIQHMRQGLFVPRAHKEIFRVGCYGERLFKKTKIAVIHD